MFDLLFATHEGREEILAVIDAEGMLEEGVSPTVRQHAWRVKAQVHLADGQVADALAALDEAQTLVRGGEEARALRLERAEMLVADSRGDDALELLTEGAPWANALLELARADGMAYVLHATGREEAARLLLAAALHAAPTPLAPTVGPRVGVRTLEAGPVALRATARLAALEGAGITRAVGASPGRVDARRCRGATRGREVPPRGRQARRSRPHLGPSPRHRPDPRRVV